MRPHHILIFKRKTSKEGNEEEFQWKSSRTYVLPLTNFEKDSDTKGKNAVSMESDKISSVCHLQNRGRIDLSYPNRLILPIRIYEDLQITDLRISLRSVQRELLLTQTELENVHLKGIAVFPDFHAYFKLWLLFASSRKLLCN